jgi:hypothetical protein
MLNKFLKSKNRELNFYEFFNLIFIKNYKFLIVLFLLSIVSSYFFFKVQNITVRISKNFTPISSLSGSNVLLEIIGVNPETILNEYIGMIELGIDKKDIKKIQEDNLNRDLDFNTFNVMRTQINVSNLRNHKEKNLYQINYSEKVQINLKEKFFKKFDELFFYDIAVKQNNKIISNLRLIDEVLKFQFLEYIDQKINLGKEEIENSVSVIDRFNNKDLKETFVEKFNELFFYDYLIKQENKVTSYLKIIDYLEINNDNYTKSFINGVDSFEYNVVRHTFSEILLSIAFFYFIIYSLIQFIRLS